MKQPASHIPIVIVSYRNPDDVLECLCALQGMAAEPAFDVYICENGGSAAFDALVSAITKVDGPCLDAPSMETVCGPMPRFARVQCLKLLNSEAGVVVAEAKENFGYAG